MSGSESQPRKQNEHMRIQNKRDYHESLYITMKPVITPIETSLAALIRIH